MIELSLHNLPGDPLSNRNERFEKLPATFSGTDEERLERF